MPMTLIETSGFGKENMNWIVYALFSGFPADIMKKLRIIQYLMGNGSMLLIKSSELFIWNKILWKKRIWNCCSNSKPTQGISILQSVCTAMDIRGNIVV